MKGADAVLHGAAIYEVGIPASRREELVEANVTGTANVLNACLDAGVPRVVYVSTCGVFGNTHGEVVDENYERSDLEFDSIYEETKYEAHLIARNLIEERDLPCVIVQPAGVYGPDDHSALGQQISKFLDGKLPMIPFGTLGMGVTHVEDIAAGIALALDKGELGESYILNAENVTMRQYDRGSRINRRQEGSFQRHADRPVEAATADRTAGRQDHGPATQPVRTDPHRRRSHHLGK